MKKFALQKMLCNSRMNYDFYLQIHVPQPTTAETVFIQDLEVDLVCVLLPYHPESLTHAPTSVFLKLSD